SRASRSESSCTNTSQNKKKGRDRVLSTIPAWRGPLLVGFCLALPSKINILFFPPGTKPDSIRLYFFGMVVPHHRDRLRASPHLYMCALRGLFVQFIWASVRFADGTRTTVE